jgi:O-6-methylguanine DNA methyltransferase
VKRASNPFSRRVLAVVRRIPPGRVATYGDVARMAGRPGAARAVGNIMRNTTAPGVPCHRVVAAGGRLGGYGGPSGRPAPHNRGANEMLKRSLLVAEGVAISGWRISAFGQVRWSGNFRHPTSRLRH